MPTKYETIEETGFTSNFQKEPVQVTNHWPNKSEIVFEVKKLLSDHHKCLKYLKQLDEELSQELIRRQICLDHYKHVEAYLEESAYVWPIIEPLHGENKIVTNRILHTILKCKENLYGYNLPEKLSDYSFSEQDITTYDPVPNFIGFVAPDAANKIVLNKGIFRDKYGAEGQDIEFLHGCDTHRIQWYILFTYLEEKYNSDHEQINNFLEQFQPLVIENWGYLFDLKGTSWSEDGFRSPFGLHSALLALQEELPTLSLYIRKTYANKLHKLVECKLQPEFSAPKKWTHEDVLRIALKTRGSFQTWRNDFNLPFILQADIKEIPISQLLKLEVKSYTLKEVIVENINPGLFGINQYKPATPLWFGTNRDRHKGNTFFLLYYRTKDSEDKKALFFYDKWGLYKEINIYDTDLFTENIEAFKAENALATPSSFTLTPEQVVSWIAHNGGSKAQGLPTFSVFFKKLRQQDKLEDIECTSPTVDI